MATESSYGNEKADVKKKSFSPYFPDAYSSVLSNQDAQQLVQQDREEQLAL